MRRVSLTGAERVGRVLGRIILQPGRVGRSGSGQNPVKKRVGSGGCGSKWQRNPCDSYNYINRTWILLYLEPSVSNESCLVFIIYATYAWFYNLCNRSRQSNSLIGSHFNFRFQTTKRTIIQNIKKLRVNRVRQNTNEIKTNCKEILSCSFLQ